MLCGSKGRRYGEAEECKQQSGQDLAVDVAIAHVHRS